LDTIEENEMLHLASFMQILLDRVPAHTQPNSARSEQSMLDEDQEEESSTIELEHIDLASVGTTVHSTVSAASVYEISKSTPLDTKVAAEIIEVVRAGGKVSLALLMRILRKVYAALKTEPNIRRLTVPPGGKITVVGDIHGQLNDLLHILDESGLPSSTNMYVFNGDFVDRGKNGVEVLIVLMALYIAEPQSVVLNRGNHEDGQITRVYGFQEECISKYDELTFGMFVEVFRYLSLFVLINERILILHGGLFNNRTVTLEDLSKINRSDYVAKPPIPYPECMDGLDSEGQWAEYYKQLQRDALWSDPQLEPGLVESTRGAGVMFGPDVAQEFMTLNNLDMIIRSHECVRKGFFLPFGPTANPAVYSRDAPLLCTLFSASNYSEGDNEGAYLVLMDHVHTHCYDIGPCGLYYSVYHYKMSTGLIEKNNKSSLAELIVKKKVALTVGFETVDNDSTGEVTRAQWAEIMQRVTTIKIRWLGIIDNIVPSDALTPATVNYRTFLAFYTVHKSGDAGAGKTNMALDCLYGQRKKLEAIFNFFDTNGDGVISREEFRIGCNFLNEHLPEGQKLTDIDHSLDLMDFDGNGMIDINEFFEVSTVGSVYFACLLLMLGPLYENRRSEY
jgi:serine/threonine-protein phosphatase with EF-hand domain